MTYINGIGISNCEEKFEKQSDFFTTNIEGTPVFLSKIHKHKITIKGYFPYISNFIIGEEYKIMCNSVFCFLNEKEIEIPIDSKIISITNGKGKDISYTIEKKQKTEKFSLEERGQIFFCPCFSASLYSISHFDSYNELIFIEN